MLSIHLNTVDITQLFGRGSDVDVRLEHESISKNHAKICFRNGTPNLMDLGSTNGTLLNGEPLTGED